MYIISNRKNSFLWNCINVSLRSLSRRHVWVGQLSVDILLKINSTNQKARFQHLILNSRSLFGTSNLVAAFGIFFNNKFLINTKQFEISSKFYIVATLASGLLLTILTFIKTKDESATTFLTTITNEKSDESNKEKSKKLVTTFGSG